MPKRKQSQQAADSKMWSSGGSSRKMKSKKVPSINESSAEKLFLTYADEDDACLSANMEGISKLCDQLDIDPMEDIRILVLLWKMGATDKPGLISKDEWMAGCNKLQVDTIAKFQELLPSLETGFLDQPDFKDFYKFCFQFNRQGTHKTLEKELVIALLVLVLKDRVSKDRVSAFIRFLEQTTQYSRITLDQWCSFLEFCLECEDLSTYDEVNSAWPVLIDEFVEYMEEQGKGKM